MPSIRRILVCVAIVLLLAGCAGAKRKDALTSTLYAYHSAIRWGDIDTAWQMVDPKYREQHPMSGVERSRYDQYAVSGYREQGSGMAAENSYRQVIEISLVNRHTQTEKVMIDQQTWRYDELTETWWLTTGLPDYTRAR
ncbi:MAG: hypothetical protein R3F12_03095 [Lysobacteraceae bacterium]|nr:hypothetical protein [Xanthomonadaceae bacterium]HRX99432.1 hypothetical protein [Xanthomonadaceae bacterium]